MRLMTLLLSAAILAGPASVAVANETTPEATPAPQTTTASTTSQMVGPQLKLSVPAIMCASCRDKIKASLKKVPEVTTVNVDIAKKTVTLKTSTKVPLDRLTATLKADGYDATLIP